MFVLYPKTAFLGLGLLAFGNIAVRLFIPLAIFPSSLFELDKFYSSYFFIGFGYAASFSFSMIYGILKIKDSTVWTVNPFWIVSRLNKVLSLNILACLCCIALFLTFGIPNKFSPYTVAWLKVGWYILSSLRRASLIFALFLFAILYKKKLISLVKDKVLILFLLFLNTGLDIVTLVRSLTLDFLVIPCIFIYLFVYGLARLKAHFCIILGLIGSYGLYLFISPSSQASEIAVLGRGNLLATLLLPLSLNQSQITDVLSNFPLNNTIFPNIFVSMLPSFLYERVNSNPGLFFGEYLFPIVFEQGIISYASIGSFGEILVNFGPGLEGFFISLFIWSILAIVFVSLFRSPSFIICSFLIPLYFSQLIFQQFEDYHAVRISYFIQQFLMAIIFLKISTVKFTPYLFFKLKSSHYSS